MQVPAAVQNVIKALIYIVVIFLSLLAAIEVIPGLISLEPRLFLLYMLAVVAVFGLFISDIIIQIIPQTAKIVEIIAFLVFMAVSLGAMFMSMQVGYTMVPTLAMGIVMIVFYRVVKTRMSKRISYIATGIFAQVIAFTLMIAGVAFQQFSSIVGPYPPLLLATLGVAMVLYTALKTGITFILANQGYQNSGQIGMAVSGILVFFIVIFGFFYPVVLDGNWDNANQMGGEVFASAITVAQSSFGFVGDQVEAYTNVELSPSRNPTFARMSCTMSIYFGGGVIGETNPDQLIANCVDDKLGRNETEAESDRVTEPVRIQVQEIELEPYSDRVNVVVPILNNLVRDINGRAINVDARDIRVNIKMERNGQTVASMEKAGEVETIEQLASGGDQIIEHAFPTFAIVGTATDAQIEQWLLRLKDCHESSENGENGDSGDSGDGSGDGSSCESELNQFLNAFDSGDLTKARVSYVNRVRVGITEASAKSYGLVEEVGEDEESDLIPAEMWNRENNIAPDRTYTVLVDVQYDFAAEAAFTQASRWQSGNYLLQLWDPVAWDELSFEARQNWESRNCNALTRYGQEVERQRTAALTTPVVPVMYTECGNTLFRRDNYYEDLSINIGATVHDEFSDGLKEDRGFKINEAETDCGEGAGMEDIGDDIGGEQDEEGWYVHQEGVGFVVEPANVTRNIDSIAGDTMTIGCRATMDLTVNFQSQTSYEVPNLQ